MPASGIFCSTLAVLQGAFYLAAGAWPLLSLPTFEAVTGPKTDRWLVRTVGLLIAISGAVLLLAAASRRVTPEIVALAAGQALALAGVDLVYGLRGRIARVYLLDAVVELVLVAGWGGCVMAT
ncbi:MAG: hypothetical protein ACE147_02165 [Candidatus Methylomirabilales bacterium]